MTAPAACAGFESPRRRAARRQSIAPGPQRRCREIGRDRLEQERREESGHEEHEGVQQREDAEARGGLAQQIDGQSRRDAAAAGSRPSGCISVTCSFIDDPASPASLPTARALGRRCHPPRPRILRVATGFHDRHPAFRPRPEVTTMSAATIPGPPWSLPLARASGPTKSSARSGPAAWAKSTAPPTPASGARSPSRSCRTGSPRRRSAGTLPARSAGGVGAQSPEHLHHLRRRHRAAVHRDGAARRRVRCSSGSIAARSDVSGPPRHRLRRSPMRWMRPTQGHRPSRHQAGEHLPHHARTEDPRLRAREGPPDPPRAATSTRRRAAEAQLTEPGSTIGTMSYMSPEQVRALPLDARTDLFSLGVVLYEMATGTRPFRGDSTGLVVDAILNRAPVAPMRLNPEVPVPNWAVIDKCLEKDRTLRYQRASDICTDLERLKRDASASLQPSATHRVLLLAATGAGYGWYLPRSRAVAARPRRLPRGRPHADAHREGHDCPRGFRQHDRRSCVR